MAGGSLMSYTATPAVVKSLTVWVWAPAAVGMKSSRSFSAVRRWRTVTVKASTYQVAAASRRHAQVVASGAQQSGATVAVMLRRWRPDHVSVITVAPLTATSVTCAVVARHVERDLERRGENCCGGQREGIGAPARWRVRGGPVIMSRPLHQRT